MHPQLRPFTRQLFLDFCAIFFPEWPLFFFCHHDSPSNLAETAHSAAISRFDCLFFASAKKHLLRTCSNLHPPFPDPNVNYMRSTRATALLDRDCVSLSRLWTNCGAWYHVHISTGLTLSVSWHYETFDSPLWLTTDKQFMRSDIITRMAKGRGAGKGWAWEIKGAPEGVFLSMTIKHL